MRTLGIAIVFLQFAAAQSTRNLGTVYDAPTGAVHLVAFGDWGYVSGNSGMTAVETAVRNTHAAAPFHLGLTLGDNFYPAGVRSIDDPAWKIWEDGHAKLGIPFFASLGNHDYQGNEQAQVEYTGRSPSKTWKMPSAYYTFTAGPIQFFALDTDEGTAGRLLFRKPWTASQADWLDAELSRSTAPWKIVYGHHPIYSDGHHGDDERLKARLLPLLKKYKVDLYLCGHEHDLEVFENDGLQFLIVGGGGKDTRKVTRKRAGFAAGRHGFLDLTASSQRLDWSIRGTDGTVLTKAALFPRSDATSPERTRTAPSSLPR